MASPSKAKALAPPTAKCAPAWLAPYLRPEEVAALVQRAEALLAAGQFPFPPDDRRAFPFPPV